MTTGSAQAKPSPRDRFVMGIAAILSCVEAINWRAVARDFRHIHWCCPIVKSAAGRSLYFIHCI